MWSPYGFSKGSDAVYPVKKRERKLRPYASATETGFLHGAASSIIVDDFTFSAFFSKNKMEANIDPVTGDILSVQVDGLHRTETEIKKKNAAEETLWGGRIDYTTGELIRTGLMHYRSKYSNGFSPSDVFDLKDVEGHEKHYEKEDPDERRHELHEERGLLLDAGKREQVPADGFADAERQRNDHDQRDKGDEDGKKNPVFGREDAECRGSEDVR